MNNNDVHGHSTDDLLERSLKAMRNEPAPNGPDEQTTARLLSALKEANSTSRARSRFARITDFFYEVLAMTFAHKIVSATLLTLAGIAAWFIFSLFSSPGYAQVAATLASVHSMSCDAELTILGQGLTDSLKVKMYFQSDGRLREELPGSMVAITDQSTGTSLLLNSVAKTATVMHTNTVNEASPATMPQIDLIEKLRNLAKTKGSELGEKKIDGINCRGFKNGDARVPMEIWVDAKTSAPVRMEVRFPMGSTYAIMVLHDIVLDANLDDSLFSLDPPKGYQLDTQDLTVDLDLDTNVVAELKAMSDSEGKFPEKLNDPKEIAKCIKVGPGGKPTPESTKAVSSIGTLMSMMYPYQRGTDYDYFPDVKPGDSSSIVFWHQDKRTEKCTEIFGDLTIKEVTPEQLPRKAIPATMP